MKNFGARQCELSFIGLLSPYIEHAIPSDITSCLFVMPRISRSCDDNLHTISGDFLFLEIFNKMVKVQFL